MALMAQSPEVHQRLQMHEGRPASFEAADLNDRIRGSELQEPGALRSSLFAFCTLCACVGGTSCSHTGAHGRAGARVQASPLLTGDPCSMTHRATSQPRQGVGVGVGVDTVRGVHEVRYTECGLVTDCIRSYRITNVIGGFFSNHLSCNTSEEIPSTCEGWKERGRNEDKSQIWMIQQTDTGSWLTGKGTSVVGERRHSFKQHKALRTDFNPKVLRSH